MKGNFLEEQLKTSQINFVEHRDKLLPKVLLHDVYLWKESYCFILSSQFFFFYLQLSNGTAGNFYSRSNRFYWHFFPKIRIICLLSHICLWNYDFITTYRKKETGKWEKSSFPFFSSPSNKCSSRNIAAVHKTNWLRNCGQENDNSRNITLMKSGERFAKCSTNIGSGMSYVTVAICMIQQWLAKKKLYCTYMLIYVNKSLDLNV